MPSWPLVTPSQLEADFGENHLELVSGGVLGLQRGYLPNGLNSGALKSGYTLLLYTSQGRFIPLRVPPDFTVQDT